MTFTVTSEATRPATDGPVPAIGEVLRPLGLGDGRLAPDELERAAALVAARTELWRPYVVDSPDRRWWRVLHRTEGYEVRLLTWEVEQGSDWHDHGGSSGGFVVVDGSLTERYRARAGAALEARSLATGDFGSFGPDHVHDMAHASGRPAVSVHTYSPPLTTLTTYAETRFGLTATATVLDEER